MRRMILKWGLAFSLVYVVLETCLLLLERRGGGTLSRWGIYLERALNLWDQGVVRQISESNWIKALAGFLFDHTPLDIVDIVFILRLATFCLIGSAVYFAVGAALGLLVSRRRPCAGSA